MLPGQIRSVIHPAVSGSASRLNVPGPPQAEILNGIQLTWFVERGSAWSSSGMYKILTFVFIEVHKHMMCIDLNIQSLIYMYLFMVLLP